MAATAGAAQPDYFPLQVGNQWIYRMGSATFVADIAKSEVFGDKDYAQLRGWPWGDAWLRMADDGTLFAWDAAQQREKVWTAFGAAEGDTFETQIDPCSKSGRLTSRNARLSSPVGEFSWALRIAYQPSCADAGFTEDFYLPYIGLVRRTVTSIAGPRTYDLIYARLGGVTVISEKEFTVSLTLDRAVYVANLMPPVDPARAVPQLSARFNVRNTQDKPVKLDFPSGQTYDLVIRNEGGDVLYQWSRGRAFTLALRSEDFGAGERNWMFTVPLGAEGKPFPQGKYVAEAWLTTIGAKTYSATVGFEIQHVQ